LFEREASNWTLLVFLRRERKEAYPFTFHPQTLYLAWHSRRTEMFFLFFDVCCLLRPICTPLGFSTLQLDLLEAHPFFFFFGNTSTDRRVPWKRGDKRWRKREGVKWKILGCFLENIGPRDKTINCVIMIYMIYMHDIAIFLVKSCSCWTAFHRNGIVLLRFLF